MPVTDWEACAGDPVFRAEGRTYAVIRIAHDHRAAAVAIAQRQGEKVALRVRAFMAADDEYVSTAAIEGHLRDLRRRYPAPVVAVYQTSPSGREHTRPMPGPEFAYHGSFFEGSAQTLRQERLVMVDLPSTPERITPAAETLMGLVTSRSLVHDGDPELAAQIGNVLARPAPKGWAITAAIDMRTHGSRPAAEALLRRLTKQGELPSIGTLVDLANLVSIRTRSQSWPSGVEEPASGQLLAQDRQVERVKSSTNSAWAPQRSCRSRRRGRAPACRPSGSTSWTVRNEGP